MTTISTRAGLQAPQLADTPANIESAVTPLRDRLESIMVMQRSVLAAQQVLEVGQLGQIRAGRPLTLADFTNMGLAAPLGLWSLSDVTDSSGNGRALVNKGAVPFAPGIMGLPGGAAQFAGSTAQALYIADTGAADPFRIKTGSWGCWFRTAKRGVVQYLMAKHRDGGLLSWGASISAGNLMQTNSSTDGAAISSTGGTTDVADDRWHFVVVTYDASRIRLYVDGALEGAGVTSGPLFASTAPLNIGAYAADATTAAITPHYGRIDEAFVTSDVLSDDQVRNLYCTRIAHSLLNGAGAALAPSGVRLSVRRRRRGRALAASDFPAPPVRIYNFVGNTVEELAPGTNTLSVTGGATSAGPDGTRDSAWSFGVGSGATGLYATDAGLPAALAARSYGIWFKTTTAATGVVLAWGTTGTADAKLLVSGTGAAQTASGADAATGPFIADGLWHYGAVVEDNAAADGVKRKLYIDGRLVAGSTVLNAITLAGAARFRIGANPDGTAPFTGQLSRGWVYAGALTPEQVRAIYNVGAQQLAASPKSEGDHVEAIDATNVLAVFDALEGIDLVDLAVVA